TRARVSDLADGDPRVRVLRALHGGEDRRDLLLRLVRVAADAELDEDRVPVLGDEAAAARQRARVAEVDDVRLVREVLHDAADRRLNDRGPRRVARALDEDVLERGLLE